MIYVHYPAISKLPSEQQIGAVERLIHRTADMDDRIDALAGRINTDAIHSVRGAWTVA